MPLIRPKDMYSIKCEPETERIKIRKKQSTVILEHINIYCKMCVGNDSRSPLCDFCTATCTLYRGEGGSDGDSWFVGMLFIRAGR